MEFRLISMNVVVFGLLVELKGYLIDFIAFIIDCLPYIKVRD